MRTHRSTNGFTLIELLVVISIISLLIALLLPALKHAREVARQAACASQARQIALAIKMYADEGDGWHPRVSWSLGNKFINSTYMRPYLGSSSSGVQEILLCPSHDPTLHRDYAANYGGTTYRIVAARGSFGSQAASFTKGSRYYGWHKAAGWSSWGGSDLKVLPRQQRLKGHVPSDYPMLADAYNSNGPNIKLHGAHFYGAPSNDILRNNHVGGANVAFADGHVSWRHKDNFTKFIRFHNFGDNSKLRW